MYHLSSFNGNPYLGDKIKVSKGKDVTKISINVSTSSLTQSLTEKFNRGIEKYWNTSGSSSSGHVYEIKLNVTYSGMLGTPDIRINTVGGRVGAGGQLGYRSHAQQGGREMTLWRDASPWTAAHEFGHILGFNDSYGKGSIALKGHEDDIMARRGSSAQWYNGAVLGEVYGN